MDDPINDRFVSVASLWEIGIKVSKGKLLLNEPFVDFVQHAVHDNGFSLLPINTAHIERLLSLPFHHKDPFDRILVAQALVENVPLVTCDKDILRYPITQVW
jgi:PIN domain nuclease of toxin-antitoxin system